MSTLRVVSLSGNKIDLPLVYTPHTEDVQLMLSSKLKCQPHQILLYYRNHLLKPFHFIPTSTLVGNGDEIIVYQIISFRNEFQEPRNRKLQEKLVIMKMNGIIEESSHITSKTKLKYKAYSEVQKKIIDSNFQQPKDFDSKMETLCSIHPNKNESEKVLRMMDCDLNDSIDYFLNPTSFFDINVKEHGTQKKSKRKVNKPPLCSVIQSYAMIINPTTSSPPQKKKKKKNRRNSSIPFVHVQNQRFTPKVQESLTFSAPSSPLRIHDETSFLRQQILPHEEEIVRELSRKTKTSYFESLQMFLLSDHNPKLARELLSGL